MGSARALVPSSSCPGVWSPAVTALPRPPHRADALCVAWLAFVLLAMGAWERPLFDADEGRYASVAKNMLQRSDGVAPHLNDMPFLDKPPLVYWVQVGAFRTLGVSPFAARMPTLLAGMLVAVFVFLFARDWSGSRRVAWLAALLWSTGMAAMVGSRVGPQMDMPLCACVSGALYAAWCGLRQPRVRSSVGLGLAVGCGLLVKGPLVVAVPGVVAAAWMVAGVSARRVRRVALSPWAWIVALLVAAPWYVLIERAHPGWIGHFAVYEHIGRFTVGDHRSFRPFWYYVPVALAYLAPWTLLVFGRGPTLHVASPLGRDDRPVRHARLAWGWFAAAFLLYSVSTRKLINYLLPAAPPLFVLVAARLDHVGIGARRVWVFLLLLGCATVGAALLVATGAWLPLRTGALPTALELSRFAPMAPWLAGAGAALVVASAVARTGNPRAVVGLVCCVAAAWWLADTGMARAGHLGSAKALAAALRTHAQPADAVVALKRYPQGLDFYDAPPVWIAGGTPGAWWQREIVNPYARQVWESRPAPGPNAEGHGSLLTTQAFERLWRSDRRVVLICRWSEVRALRAHRLAGPFAGAGRTDLYLVSNRPATIRRR